MKIFNNNNLNESSSFEEIVQHHIKKQKLFNDIVECTRIIAEELVSAFDSKHQTLNKKNNN